MRLRALVAAIVERALRAADPWISRRVRAWLGEEADHGRLSFSDGAVRVDGATLPLGPRFSLADLRASIPDVLAFVARGETRARIEHARIVEVPAMPAIEASATLGVTQAGWRVDDGVLSCGDARASFDVHGWFAAPSARARVEVARLGADHVRALLATFAPSDAVRALRVPDDVVVSGELTWDRSSGTKASLVVVSGASRVAIELAIDALGVLGDVKLAGTIAMADALATGAVPDSLASRMQAIDARATGELVVRDGAIAGPVEATTATSRVAVDLALAKDGAPDGTALRGTLSFADAFALGLFPGPVRPRRVGAMEVDAKVRGGAASASIRGRVVSRELRLRLGDDAALPTIAFHDVDAQLEIDAKQVAWRALRAKVLGGVVTSSGSVALDDGTVAASVGVAGVPLEAIAVDAKGTTPLADRVRGSAHVELDVAVASSEITARGRARVIDPDFLFLTAAADKLARYGLAAPPTRGAGPVEVDVVVRDRTLHASPIVARLEGIDVDGGVAVGFDGALSGTLNAHLLQGYLRRSILLAVPAALADRVTVPVTISGTVRAPDVSADFVHTLDDFLQKNAIGSAVTGVMDEIWGALGGPRAPRSSRPPATDGVDAIIDRILGGAGDADALIDELVEAGLDEDEIERRIAKRRARRGG